MTTDHSHAGSHLVTNKHVVVTGGSRGIGRAIAASLSALGGRVTIMGRNETTLAQAAAALGEVSWQTVDITDKTNVDQAFAKACDESGPVEVLINNAGAASSAPFAKTSDSLWHDMLAVNLSGMFYCQQAVLNPMRETHFGRIVNIVSTAGLIGYAYVAAYCAAKHGAIGLTRALALETARDGITVNAVCPGFTETDLLEDSLENIMQTTGRSRAEAEKSLTAVNPQRRFIQPEEVAETVVWLCSAGAASITGQAIAVAGGEVM